MSIFCQRRDWEFLGQGGVSKGKDVKEMYFSSK